ncbi:MAG: hypothetical protein WCO56_26525 [Verrucomicrobiota bacterium]
MGLDIRLPIGIMFSLVGALLVLAGISAKPDDLKPSLGININLWWGFILLVFAGWMLFMAWRVKSAPQNPAPKK